MKQAFTLSEILLVLSVLGIVSALTIPALVQKVNDNQYKVAWKKTYSAISQASNRILADNGGSLKYLCSTGDENCLMTKYTQYLSSVKTCNEGNVFIGGCWSDLSSFKWLSGTTITTWYNVSGIVLSDGTMLMFHYDYSDCSLSGSESGTLKRCGIIVADVNGLKGPNIFGKDMFKAFIMEDSIKPFGYQGDPWDPVTDCTSTGTGKGCSALYIYQ